MVALVLAASDVSAVPVLVLMGAGVLIGIIGHLAGSRGTVVVGLAVLFVATALMIIGASSAYNDDRTDPRPRGEPGGF